MAKWLLRVVLGLVGLVAVALLVLYLWGEKMRRDVAADLQAKGESIVLADFLPPPIPDAENFFGDPEWKELQDLVPAKDGLMVEPRVPHGQRMLDKLSPKLTEAQLADLKAGWPEFSEGLMETCGAVPALWKKQKNLSSPEARRLAEFTLARLQPSEPLYQKLQEWAKRPKADLPQDFTGDALPAFQHLSYLLSASKNLDQRARAELVLGQNETALKDVLLQLHLAETLRGQIGLINWLVEVSTLRIAMGTIRTGLEIKAWQADDLIALEARLQRITLLADYAQCLRGERALLELHMPKVLKRMGEESTSGSVMERFSQFVYRTCVPYDSALTKREYQRTIDGIGQASIDGLPTPWAREFALEKPKDLSWGWPVGFSLKIMRPALLDWEALALETETEIIQTRIACALERYWLKNGSYPETFQALVPEFLAAVPVDIIDNQPMRYRLKSPQEYSLYSVGFNRVDEGGRPAEEHRRKVREGSSTTEKEKHTGDWVWGQRGPKT